MATRIRAQDYGRIVRRRLKRDRTEIRKAAAETAAQAVAELVEATDRAGLVDRGEFRNGWRNQRTPTGGKVGNEAPHAQAIEEGRRPNRPGPPLAPIRRWVERKIQPPPEQLDRIAWAIRNKIHREGSEPKLILRSYRPRLMALFRANVRRRLSRSGR